MLSCLLGFKPVLEEGSSGVTELKYPAFFTVKYMIYTANAVGSDFLLLKTAFCDPSQCLPVNSSSRLPLVATCSHLSICYIGLGALSKLLKVTICFVISVRPSVRRKQIVFHYRNFCDIQYLKIIPISVDLRQFSIKSDNNNGHAKPYPEQSASGLVLELST
jgi:hypothetical protein